MAKTGNFPNNIIPFKPYVFFHLKIYIGLHTRLCF